MARGTGSGPQIDLDTPAREAASRREHVPSDRQTGHDDHPSSRYRVHSPIVACRCSSANRGVGRDAVGGVMRRRLPARPARLQRPPPGPMVRSWALAVEDNQLRRREVTVRRQVAIADYRLVFAPPKYGKERTVALAPAMSDALACHLTHTLLSNTPPGVGRSRRPGGDREAGSVPLASADPSRGTLQPSAGGLWAPSGLTAPATTDVMRCGTSSHPPGPTRESPSRSSASTSATPIPASRCGRTPLARAIRGGPTSGIGLARPPRVVPV